jgi:hypothetical protein
LVPLDKLYPLENFALYCIFSVSNANFSGRQLLLSNYYINGFLWPTASQVFNFLSWFFSAGLNSIFSDIYSL